MNEIEIKKIVEPILDDENLFLVDVVIKGHQANQKIIILADGDNGISIDQCGSVSRKVGNIIEEEDLIDQKYTLEVSSPGLDFPLKGLRQYQKNVGRILQVQLESGEAVEGVLDSVDEEKLRLTLNKDQKEYPFEDIKQSKVKISFK